MPVPGVPFPDESSMMGDYGADVLQQQYNVPPTSPMVSVLENFPTASSTMGWNAWRGSRTIMKGGFDQTAMRLYPGRRAIGRWMQGNLENGPGRRGIPGVRRLRNSNPFRPRSFGRMADQSMLHSNELSPLNFMAPSANWAAKWMLGNKNVTESAKGGATIGRLQAMGAIKGTEGEEYFSRGFVARLQAGNKVGKKGTLSGRKLKNVESFIKGDTAMAEALAKAEKGRALMGGMKGAGAARAAYSGTDYAHMLGMSMKGSISQYASGYVRSAVSGGMSDVVKQVGGAAGKESYLRGASRATESLSKVGLQVEGGVIKTATGEAGEAFAKRAGLRLGEGGVAKVGMGTALKFGGKQAAGVMAARAAGMAIPGVNAVLTAMMVYDITKMGIGMMKGAVQTAADAGKSFKGSIEKGVMGGGYRDTTVAATSRQRGVMAIQSSQLNARSVLGAEGSMVHARFG